MRLILRNYVAYKKPYQPIRWTVYDNSQTIHKPIRLFEDEQMIPQSINFKEEVQAFYQPNAEEEPLHFDAIQLNNTDDINKIGQQLQWETAAPHMMIEGFKILNPINRTQLAKEKLKNYEDSLNLTVEDSLEPKIYGEEYVKKRQAQLFLHRMTPLSGIFLDQGVNFLNGHVFAKLIFTNKLSILKDFLNKGAFETNDFICEEFLLKYIPHFINDPRRQFLLNLICFQGSLLYIDDGTVPDDYQESYFDNQEYDQDQEQQQEQESFDSLEQYRESLEPADEAPIDILYSKCLDVTINNRKDLNRLRIFWSLKKNEQFKSERLFPLILEELEYVHFKVSGGREQEVKKQMNFVSKSYSTPAFHQFLLSLFNHYKTFSTFITAYSLAILGLSKLRSIKRMLPQNKCNQLHPIFQLIQFNLSKEDSQQLILFILQLLSHESHSRIQFENFKRSYNFWLKDYTQPEKTKYHSPLTSILENSQQPLEILYERNRELPEYAKYRQRLSRNKESKQVLAYFHQRDMIKHLLKKDYEPVLKYFISTFGLSARKDTYRQFQAEMNKIDKRKSFRNKNEEALYKLKATHNLFFNQSLPQPLDFHKLTQQKQNYDAQLILEDQQNLIFQESYLNQHQLFRNFFEAYQHTKPSQYNYRGQTSNQDKQVPTPLGGQAPLQGQRPAPQQGAQQTAQLQASQVKIQPQTQKERQEARKKDEQELKLRYIYFKLFEKFQDQQQLSEDQLSEDSISEEYSEEFDEEFDEEENNEGLNEEQNEEQSEQQSQQINKNPWDQSQSEEYEEKSKKIRLKSQAAYKLYFEPSRLQIIEDDSSQQFDLSDQYQQLEQDPTSMKAFFKRKYQKLQNLNTDQQYSGQQSSSKQERKEANILSSKGFFTSKLNKNKFQFCTYHQPTPQNTQVYDATKIEQLRTREVDQQFLSLLQTEQHVSSIASGSSIAKYLFLHGKNKDNTFALRPNKTLNIEFTSVVGTRAKNYQKYVKSSLFRYGLSQSFYEELLASQLKKYNRFEFKSTVAHLICYNDHINDKLISTICTICDKERIGYTFVEIAQLIKFNDVRISSQSLEQIANLWQRFQVINEDMFSFVREYCRKMQIPIKTEFYARYCKSLIKTKNFPKLELIMGTVLVEIRPKQFKIDNSMNNFKADQIAAIEKQWKAKQQQNYLRLYLQLIQVVVKSLENIVPPYLSTIFDQYRKMKPDFNEREFGYAFICYANKREKIEELLNRLDKQYQKGTSFMYDCLLQTILSNFQGLEQLSQKMLDVTVLKNRVVLSNEQIIKSLIVFKKSSSSNSFSKFLDHCLRFQPDINQSNEIKREMFFILNNNVEDVSAGGIFNLLDFIFNEKREKERVEYRKIKLSEEQKSRKLQQIQQATTKVVKKEAQKVQAKKDKKKAKRGSQIQAEGEVEANKEQPQKKSESQQQKKGAPTKKEQKKKIRKQKSQQRQKQNDLFDQILAEQQAKNIGQASGSNSDQEFIQLIKGQTKRHESSRRKSLVSMGTIFEGSLQLSRQEEATRAKQLQKKNEKKGEVDQKKGEKKAKAKGNKKK